jgi:uncharacterized membrane protein
MALDVHPLVTGAPTGLGLGPTGLARVHLLPAAALALTLRGETTREVRPVAMGWVFLCVASYLTLALRLAFHAPVLTGPVTEFESVAYSLLWLAIGLAVYVAGYVRRATGWRRLGIGLALAVTVKTVLLDATALEGLARALAFLGLGLGLVAMAWLFRRLERAASPAGPGSAPAPHP